MPVLLDGSHPPVVRVEVGDVLMVAKRLKDKVTKKPYVWRYFMVVTKFGRHLQYVKGIRLGAEEGHDDTVLYGISRNTDWTIEYLDPDEWPDGVHAFRTKLILEGRIEGLI